MARPADRQARSQTVSEAISISFPERPKRLQGASTAGFTLLEILVALAVLGFLLIGLLQGSRFVLFGWETHSRLLERNADLDAVDRTLRHLIEQAKPGSEWEKLVFTGTASSLTFTGIMPLQAADLPTRRADIELIVDANHRLLLVWTPHLHVARIGRPPPAQTTEIMQGVERLQLAYLPATPAPEWTPVWRDSTPPRLVRIRIIFSDAGHPPWPDIVAAPMIDLP